MNSPNVEVQCNAVGCITNLATHEENKARIARSGALAPLTRLAKSKDMRVQRNATGALLNMTHSDDNRQQLVAAGAIPVLVSLLSSPDTDVQYYCTTALSNIAVDSANRKRLAQTETKLVQSLVHLMKGQAPKVQCQAALALRNLASDEKYQLEIVRAGGLPPLLHLLQSSYLPLILSAVACIRNISIHPMNESPIIDAGFLRPLVDLLGSTDNEEIQCHAISTLRNLAASSDRNKQLVLEAGAVQKCKELVLEVPLSVQSEMTAAIAVLALSDDLKPHLLDLGVFDVLIPLTESESIEVQGNSAAALGNLSSKGMFSFPLPPFPLVRIVHTIKETKKKKKKKQRMRRRTKEAIAETTMLTYDEPNSRRLHPLPNLMVPPRRRHPRLPRPLPELRRSDLPAHRYLDPTAAPGEQRPQPDPDDFRFEGCDGGCTGDFSTRGRE